MMKHVDPSELEKERVSHAAKALLDAEDDIPRAIALLEERALSSRSIRDHLLRPYVGAACSDAIWNIVRKQRQAVWSGGKGHNITAGATKRIVASIERSLMDFRLPSGIYLRDATKVDIAIAREFYGKQAKDMTHKERWLAAIESKMRGQKTVGASFKDDELARLQADTEIP